MNLQKHHSTFVQKCSTMFEQNKQLVNPDVQRFERGLTAALLAMLALMIIAGMIWAIDGRAIAMVDPLQVHKQTCLDLLSEQCTALKNRLDLAHYHPLSVVEITGVAATVASLVMCILAFTFTYFKIKAQYLNKRYKKLLYISRSVIITGVSAWFVSVFAEVLIITIGLITPETPFHAVTFSIAALTTGVLVCLVSFIVFTWAEQLNLSNITGFAIFVLVISLLLAIFFTTRDWTGAFSDLGKGNHSFRMAGANGSSGLFRCAFVSMGLLIWAYVMDTILLYLKHAECTHQHRKIIVIALIAFGGLIGIGAMMVGLIPSDESEFWHNVGAFGAPIISLILIVTLCVAFPYHEGHRFRNNRPIVHWSGGAIIAILIVVGSMKAFDTHGKMISTLEAEFVFICVLMLFLQMFALYLTEFLDEEAVEQTQLQQIVPGEREVQPLDSIGTTAPAIS